MKTFWLFFPSFLLFSVFLVCFLFFFSLFKSLLLSDFSLWFYFWIFPKKLIIKLKWVKKKMKDNGDTYGSWARYQIWCRGEGDLGFVLDILEFGGEIRVCLGIWASHLCESHANSRESHTKYLICCKSHALNNKMSKTILYLK